jgi:hypothetical protein
MQRDKNSVRASDVVNVTILSTYLGHSTSCYVPQLPLFVLPSNVSITHQAYALPARTVLRFRHWYFAMHEGYPDKCL